MADDENPEVVYEKRKLVRAGVRVRYKFIYPAAGDRYPPGVCYALHYGVADLADPPDDIEWPIGSQQGTMLRYDNDHGDGTYHRHIDGTSTSPTSFQDQLRQSTADSFERQGSNRSGHPRRTTTHD